VTRLAFDIKTSAEDTMADGRLRTPFPEVGLQLAAYINSPIAAVWRARQVEQFKRRYYLLNESERALAVPVPEVDGGVAILLTPTRYAVHPVNCDAEVFDCFLHLLDVARFPLELASHVVKAPLMPPPAFTPAPDDADDPFAGLPKED
jgi:hypothetical protein